MEPLTEIRMQLMEKLLRVLLNPPLLFIKVMKFIKSMKQDCEVYENYVNMQQPQKKKATGNV